MKKPIVLTAPSGAGKTTLKDKLLPENNDYEFVVSCTTRDPRINPKTRIMEQDGVDYYFESLNSFNQKLTNNEFIEHEEVYPGCFYGVTKKEVLRIQELGKIPMFDVDVNGAKSLKEKLGDEIKVVFISPESIDQLKTQLIGRGTDSEEKIKERLARAEYEMSFRDTFDAVIVNQFGKPDEAFAELKETISRFNEIKEDKEVTSEKTLFKMPPIK